MAAFTNRRKGDGFAINFAAERGLPGIERGCACPAMLDDNAIVCACRLPGLNDTVSLSYEIYPCQFRRDQECKKLMLGRTLVGGLLMESFDSVLGGIDGMGVNKRKRKRKFVEIWYSANERKRNVLLEIVGATLGLKKFEQRLSEMAPHMEFINLTKREAGKASEPVQTTLQISPAYMGDNLAQNRTVQVLPSFIFGA